MRIMRFNTEARIAISNIIYILDEHLQDDDDSDHPELVEAHGLLRDEYDKQEEILWLYSKDIMRYGTEDDREKMVRWAMECSQVWNGSDWVPH